MEFDLFGCCSSANRRRRLPRAGRYAVFRGPLGDILFRPWLDPLARAWGVPDANLFLRRQGHFSVALGLLHDLAPPRRLEGILTDRG